MQQHKKSTSIRTTTEHQIPGPRPRVTERYNVSTNPFSWFFFFGAITKQIVYENKLKLQLIRGNTHAGIFNSADDGRRLEALMASDGIY